MLTGKGILAIVVMLMVAVSAVNAVTAGSIKDGFDSLDEPSSKSKKKSGIAAGFDELDNGDYDGKSAVGHGIQSQIRRLGCGCCRKKGS
jgi:hypothetical protein